MNDLDNQVKEALQNVQGAYDDFVSGCAEDVEGHPEQQKELLEYLKQNPDAGTGDVIKKIITDIMPDMLDEEE